MKLLMKFAFSCLFAGGLMLSAAAQDVVNTVIGGGPNNIPSVDANQYNPYEVAVDSANNVYVASQQLNRIFKISTAGIVTVVAGNGIAGYSGDGKAATAAELNNPWGVAVDSASPANVFIADRSNCLVRKVTTSTGIITTIAGLVENPTTTPSTSCGYSGDGGRANAAQLYYPSGLAVNPSNDDLYIVDYAYGVVRKVAGGSATGSITTVAGSGGNGDNQSNCQGSAPYGDGGAAKSGFLCNPQAVALDTSVSPANLFITEGSRCTVREVVGSSQKIYLLAGSYSLGCGFTDNVNALSGQLNDPWQMHVAVSGSTTTVQVADYYNARIRQFSLTYSSAVPKSGTITTIGGKGQGGFCNDGGPVLDACMNPVGLAYDSSGNYYIGDYGSDRVRKVLKSNSTISTINGWGPNGGTQPNFSDPVGLNGVAGGTPSLYYPTGVWADPNSTYVYVGGYDGEAVYQWNSANNELSSFAGSGVAGFAGDGSAASSTATDLNQPIGIGRDSKGNTYIADSSNCAIRQVSSSGTITTIAGGSSGSLKGCGYTNSSAVDSQFNAPNGVALDAANNIYIADYNNCAIRKITASTDDVSTLAGGPTVGCGYSGDQGPAVKAQISGPQEISLDGAGNIYFADQNNLRIREIVAQTGIIQTVAGDGAGGYTGDGPATERTVYYPAGVASDPSGNLFISDTDNQMLRWVTPTGQMITFAGIVPPSAGFSGDGGPALKAQFYQPAQISRDSSGNTYVADEYNHRVRQVSPFAGYGLSASALSFETQPAGTVSDFQALAVSAVGPTTISGISVSSGFSEVDDCVGQSLSANQICEVDVYFQPSAAGKVNGTLTIASDAFFAANPSTVSLTGTAAGLKLTGSFAFGSEALKTPVSNTLTLTNSGSAVTVSKIYLTSTTAFSRTGGTCPTASGSLAAGANCTIIVTFNPQTVGAQKSTLVVTSNDPASPLLTVVSGTGTEVKVSATAIAFGSISYGTTAVSNLTVSNTGTTSFTLAPSISGAGFVISSTGKTCSSSLAAGASCVLPVEYDPAAVGSNTGTLTITTNGGANPSVALTGTATADASASPAALAFGTITHATTKVLDVTVSNKGKIASMTVKTGISGTGAADFSVLTTGNTCATALAPGKSCVLPVQFKPAAAAAYAASLTVTTNGGVNPTVSLSGTGK